MFYVNRFNTVGSKNIEKSSTISRLWRFFDLAANNLVFNLAI